MSYVSGDWMDIRGGYILTEHETGLPTHYAPLALEAESAWLASCKARSGRLVCATLFAAASLTSLLLGAAVENYFDVLP